MLRLISIILLICFFFTSTLAPAVAAINYIYDANGNMTSDGTRCFEYNDANQLKKVKTCVNNQTIAEYLYDHNGKRLVKKEYENGTLKYTIYSPTDEYETKKLPNGTTENTTFFKVNDEVVAKKNPDGSLTHFHNDHLGSTSVLTNQSGEVVEKTVYEPYGEVKTGGTKSKFQYTGQEKDNETGLNYYDARYYDPHIHRFIQPDTLLPDVYDPQQLNRYAYARNNPLKYTDPTGHFVQFAPILAAIGSAIGAAPLAAAAVVGAGLGYAFVPQFRDLVNTSASSAIKNIATSFNKPQPVKPVSLPKNEPLKNNNLPQSPQGSSQGPNMNPVPRILPFVPPAVNENLQKTFTNAQDFIKNGNNILRIGNGRVSIGPAPSYYDKMSTLEKIISPIHIHIEKNKAGIDINWIQKSFYKTW